jgi:hypothetical protein
MDQEKAIQSCCKYYRRCGKARNGPGKGNPISKADASIRGGKARYGKRQFKVDASVRGGKAQNGPGKGNPKQMQV